MRTDLIFRPTFGFTRHTVTGTPNTSTDTIDYTWTEEGRYQGSVIPMSGGVQLMTREPLLFNEKVTDITDRLGNTVYGVALYVHGVDAQVDPYGRVIGYKNTLRVRVPRDSEADFIRAIENAGN